MRIIAGLILQLIFISSFCQPDCVIMNKCNKLAYNKDYTTKLYNGDCKQFDNKGRIKSHGYFINGKLIYAKNWTKDGNLIDSIHYTNYFDNSYEIYVWWDNGNLKTSQFYKNDTIIDTCTFYFQNGLVDNEQIFNKGKILKQTYYFDNGKPKRIVNYKDDQIVNPVYEWDKFGNKYEVIEKVNGQYKFLGAILWTSDIISKTIISNDSSKTARLDDSIIKCDDGLVFKTCITYKNNKEHGLWNDTTKVVKLRRDDIITMENLLDIG